MKEGGELGIVKVEVEFVNQEIDCRDDVVGDYAERGGLHGYCNAQAVVESDNRRSA